MPGFLLTTASTILCTHGGSALLTTTDQRARAGAQVLLESDIHVVAGCPFTVGSNPSPCVRIEWSAGSPAFRVNGTRALVQSSIGTCYNAASAPQGVAVVVPGQFRARAH